MLRQTAKKEISSDSENVTEKHSQGHFSTKHPIVKNALKNVESLSFEETHKTAYSHGLEAIYSLENVDVKTIRRLGDSKPKTSPKNIQKPFCSEENPQLEFDLGPLYRGWIEPFVLREPIQVLGLPRHAEKCLIDHGKLKLKDLIDADIRSFVFFKGMGQAHVDEIRQKLDEYLNGRSLTKSYQIDFASWVKSLVACFDKKKAFCLLESCEIHDLIVLSPMELIEVRRLKPELRLEWVEELIAKLKHPDIASLVKKDLKTIAEAFLKPWMAARGGYALEEEVKERFHLLSLARDASSYLNFFSGLYADPVAFGLIPVEESLFADSDRSEANYRMAISLALSYFYKPHAVYALDELIRLMETECAKRWIGFPDGFLAKILRLSPAFIVRKDPASHKLTIRLA